MTILYYDRKEDDELKRDTGRKEEEALEVLRVLSKPFQERKKLKLINVSDNALGLKGTLSPIILHTR